MVYDGDTIIPFIDGSLDTFDSISVPHVDSEQSVKIGLEDIAFGSRNFVDGMIDKVRIYNRALSEAEIQELDGIGCDGCSMPCEEDELGRFNIVETRGTMGSDVTLPVEINTTPNQVASLRFDVVSGEGCLKFEGFQRGDLTFDSDFFDCSAFSPGVVRCGGSDAGAGIPSGVSGNVVDLTFRITTPDLDPPDGAVKLNLQNLVDDFEGWPTSPGWTCSECSCDVNGEGQVTPTDALCAFQKYLGICPTACGPCEDIGCDVNMDEDCTPADALEIFKEYLGLPSVCSQ